MSIKIKSSYERLPLARNEKLVYNESSWLPIRVPIVEPGDLPIMLEVGHVCAQWTRMEGITEYRCVPFRLKDGNNDFHLGPNQLDQHSSDCDHHHYQEAEACLATIRIDKDDDRAQVTTLWIVPDHAEHWPYFLANATVEPLTCSVCAKNAARYASQVESGVVYCGGECALVYHAVTT